MAGALFGPFGRHELTQEVVTLGRYPINTIVLPDPLASGNHAEIRPEGSGYVLLDLGSSNGTTLNGQRLLAQTPQLLQSGDVIDIGTTSLRVELAVALLPPTIRANEAAPGAFAPTQHVAAPAHHSATPDAPAPASQYHAPGGPPPAYAPPIPALVPPPVLPPPPAAKKSSARRILLIVGGILTLVLLACVVGGVLVGKAIYAHTPEGVANAYYSNLESLDYSSAYQDLDTVNQQLFTFEAQQHSLADGSQFFAVLFSCLDRQFGGVTTFSTTLLKQNNSAATVRVEASRPRARYTDTIGLIPEQGNWRIALFELPPGQQCATITPGQQ